MSKILELVGMRVNVDSVNNDDAPEQEYVVKGYGVIDIDKCRSTKEFRDEYKDLGKKVEELQAELAELRSEVAS